VRPSRGGDERISLIAAGAGEFKEYRATLVQRDTVIYWPVPKIETDERVGRHQRRQLENGIAGTAACTSAPSRNERNRLELFVRLRKKTGS
jgi:hypothetical protein